MAETEQVSGADQELARIADTIVTLADARQGERKPYLVSALGIDLGEDLRTLKRLTGKGLNEFIQSQLAGRVTLVRFGTHGNVTAILPGAVEPGEVPALETVAQPQPKKRFHYRFWAAFSVPLTAEVRVLDPDTFTFDDVAQAAVPDGALTISPDAIAPVDAPDRDAAIKANISVWLKRHDLPEDRFLAQRRLPRTTTPSARVGTSLLDAMIATLDRKQLQSTTLSLDVVATLLRTPLS